MMEGETATLAALIGGLVALITAGSAGLVKIIAELRKITNGKMGKVGDQMDQIISLERANLKYGSKIVRELKALRRSLTGSVVRAGGGSQDRQRRGGKGGGK